MAIKATTTDMKGLTRTNLFLLSKGMGLEIQRATKKAVIIAQILQAGVDDDELSEYCAQAQRRECGLRQSESERKERECREAEERAQLREIELKKTEVELKRLKAGQLGKSEPDSSKPESPDIRNLMQPFKAGGDISDSFWGISNAPAKR